MNKTKPMTKREYIDWVRTRDKNPAKWNFRTCVEADALIKRQTIINLGRILKAYKIPNVLKSYIATCAIAYFGSVETDDMLMALKAYPKWTTYNSREEK